MPRSSAMHTVQIMTLMATIVDASMVAQVAMQQKSSGEGRRSLPTRAQLDASCRPIKAYSTVEVAAWLAARGYNTSSFLAENIDGEALAYYAHADPRVGQEVLRELGVPLSKIGKLLDQIKGAREPMRMHLPPGADPCSLLSVWHGGAGTDLFTTVLVEKVVSLDQNANTFEVVFKMLYVWDEDRIRYLPDGSQDEMSACKHPCVKVGSPNAECPMDKSCAVGVMDSDPPGSKCCDGLWTPVRSEGGDFQRLFANALALEVEYSDLYMFQWAEREADTLMILTERVKGTFAIPMTYKMYPTDRQELDIHLAFKGIASYVRYQSANGIYLRGGEQLPLTSRDKFNSSDFEELSGWWIEKDVKVQAYNSSTDYLLWFHPGYALKFEIMGQMFNQMGLKPTPENLEMVLASGRAPSFIIIQAAVDRIPNSFYINIMVSVTLLNLMNILSFLLSPEAIEARLASCGTMILALMAFQIVVSDNIPKTGYSMGALDFLLVSNVFMVIAAMESVIVFWLHTHRVTPFAFMGGKAEASRVREVPELLLHHLKIVDRIFISFYLYTYGMLLCLNLFERAMVAWAIGGGIVVAVHVAVEMPRVTRVFKEAGASVREHPGGAPRPETSERASEQHFQHFGEHFGHHSQSTPQGVGKAAANGSSIQPGAGVEHVPPFGAEAFGTPGASGWGEAGECFGGIRKPLEPPVGYAAAALSSRHPSGYFTT